jgi:hypothetical protein
VTGADAVAHEIGVFVRGVADRVGAATVLLDAEVEGGTGNGREARIVGLGGHPGEGPYDLVVAVDAPLRTADWEPYLGERAKLARKALIVVTVNADRASARGGGPDTVAIAGVLWRVGRVREHVYLGVPRLVAPGPVSAPASRWVRWTARRHAFVVDTAPRTPQARRRLRTVERVG